jgi:hypothetical protein
MNHPGGAKWRPYVFVSMITFARPNARVIVLSLFSSKNKEKPPTEQQALSWLTLRIASAS